MSGDSYLDFHLCRSALPLTYSIETKICRQSYKPKDKRDVYKTPSPVFGSSTSSFDPLSFLTSPAQVDTPKAEPTPTSRLARPRLYSRPRPSSPSCQLPCSSPPTPLHLSLPCPASALDSPHASSYSKQHTPRLGRPTRLDWTRRDARLPGRSRCSYPDYSQVA